MNALIEGSKTPWSTASLRTIVRTHIAPDTFVAYTAREAECVVNVRTAPSKGVVLVSAPSRFVRSSTVSTTWPEIKHQLCGRYKNTHVMDTKLEKRVVDKTRALRGWSAHTEPPDSRPAPWRGNWRVIKDGTPARESGKFEQVEAGEITPLCRNLTAFVRILRKRCMSSTLGPGR